MLIFQLETLLKIYHNFYLFFYAATIFAYGQTSSGKTYTMRGVTESAVNDIYKHIGNVILMNYLSLLTCS